MRLIKQSSIQLTTILICSYLYNFHSDAFCDSAKTNLNYYFLHVAVYSIKDEKEKYFYIKNNLLT